MRSKLPRKTTIINKIKVKWQNFNGLLYLHHFYKLGLPIVG
ncbi:hypothetical protein MGSAQ_002295 [marine sediment metagenome]|uniref:Uncharacterized protein n=1 Tax=marine sediment metagenome TaxID=412755 RepID=A0A1B6NRY0_9ZZZZ